MSKINYLLLLALLILASCDEFIDEDISNSTIEVIAPVDNLVTTKTTLTFWWNELDEAANYRLQIVSTSFDTILSIPLDTLLTSNKFEITLNPNRYQWRVKAINSGSETQWFTRNLTIEDVPDLSDQEVSLTTPKDQDVFGQKQIFFQWKTISNASYYALIICENEWTDDENDSSMEFTKKDTLTKELSEGTYVWGVRAYNNNSQSKTQRRTLIVDLTPPDKPVLNEPEDNATVSSSPVDLTWDYTSPDATSVYDSIYIAKENTFSSSSKLFFEKSTTKSYRLTTDYTGKVYWRVKTIDKAGNKSAFSDTFTFTIQ